MAGIDASDANDAYKVISDLRYSDTKGRRGLCDLYLPNHARPEHGFPVVVVVHGGGWISGDKWTIAGYGRVLAENGVAAVVINYRLAPAAKFPKQLDDVRQALIWTRQNAGKYGLAPNRLGLFGYSAGGHLSLLMATIADEPFETRLAASQWNTHDPRWKQLPYIKAVCVGGPPCNFQDLPIDNTALAYFLGGSRREKPDTYRIASPIQHISKDDPITRLIHGTNDVIVPIISSVDFHAAAEKIGMKCELKSLPGQGHVITFLNPKTSEAMTEFFQEHLVEQQD